jgi:hypothetical protein
VPHVTGLIGGQNCGFGTSVGTLTEQLTATREEFSPSTNAGKPSGNSSLVTTGETSLSLQNNLFCMSKRIDAVVTGCSENAEARLTRASQQLRVSNCQFFLCSIGTVCTQQPNFFSSSILHDQTSSPLYTVMSGHPSHIFCSPFGKKSTG